MSMWEQVPLKWNQMDGAIHLIDQISADKAAAILLQPLHME